MKRKNYKVKVKLIFETTMDHSQTSMQKAQEDVNRVLTDYLKDKKLNILNLFNDRPPRIIYKVEKKDDNVQGEIILTLKYGEKKERVITGLKRISKPGLRVYVKNDEIPRVLNGLGIAIISTSQGIMTDKQARKENLGGEVLAYIW